MDRSDRSGIETARSSDAAGSDADGIPGSTHFVSVYAYADFALVDGPRIRCEAVPGLSAFAASRRVQKLASGQLCVELRRIMTHYQSDEPAVAIEQHHARESSGTLTSSRPGALLPGNVAFSHYLILTLAGRPFANPKPLVLVASDVGQWPPIGCRFASEEPTAFVDLELIDDPDAPTVAHLVEFTSVSVGDVGHAMPREHRDRTVG
ncbi:MAG TPA: hypothetical protein VGO81_12965 [Solirubrobacteraceae bacterium]|nr:hypothetical protein [Solirubrobacteraceae bacterium]